MSKIDTQLPEIVSDLKRAFITMDIAKNGDISKSLIYDIATVSRGTLFIDPLTQLVSYESMANFIRDRLSQENLETLFLAIGDVDGLRDYVSSCNTSMKDMFGHVAGNHCMKLVGATVTNWQTRQNPSFTWLSGTFGGDEVIVFSQGGCYDDFVERVRELSDDIARICPRPCSFACSEYSSSRSRQNNPNADYTAWVSRIDRALFEAKSIRQKNQAEGFVITC